MSRIAKINRETKETKIDIKLDLDGVGKSDISTGIGFFDHMLEQLSFHSCIDLELHAQGDLHIDTHHTIEDIAISLGKAINQAIGDKKGMVRYAHSYVVMDEALVRSVIDFSGRPYLVWGIDIPVERIGDLETELIEHFFYSFAMNSLSSLHIDMIRGNNSHHIVEATFKSLAKAIRQAVEYDPKKVSSIPSTKGVL